jgi:hypothetical protein
MKALFMAIAILFLITACSKDDYCDVKSNLLGSWVNENEVCDTLWFYENNSFKGSIIFTNDYQYGFTTLDTIAFIKNSGLYEFSFSVTNKGNNLIIEKFNRENPCGFSGGVQPMINQNYIKLN